MTIYAITPEQANYMFSLLETVANPQGDGSIFHEVRLGPEITAQARKWYGEILELNTESKHNG